MAEKISKIILKVDLECCHCSKKIKKILCKYQDRWNIKSIVYDEKNNTVTITGPLDPKKLVKKLCCKACKVIKDIQIVEDKPPPPPPPQEPKPAPPPEPAPEPAPPEPAPVPPEPEPVPPAPPVEVPAPPSPDPEPEPQKVEANPPPPEPEVAPEPEAKAPEPVVCEPVQPAEPACPPGWQYGNGPPCCCWYHGTCRCCTCGRGCGPYGGYGLLPVAVVATPTVVYGGGPCYDGYKTCELICEEDNSCMIM